MLLYIIRHGEPNYETDTLTETGKKQAELVSQRLILSGIDEIHASNMGRAQMTAQPLSEKLKLPIITEPWARELGEEADTTFPDGVKKIVSRLPGAHFHQKKYLRLDTDEAFDTVDGLTEKSFKERYHAIADGLDNMLKEHGYARNKDGLYEVTEPNDKHIALFCHAGMTRVMISHLLDIPYHHLVSSIYGTYTGVTIFNFRNDNMLLKEGEKIIVSPDMLSFSDTGHLYFKGEEQIHYYTHERF